MIPFAHSAAAAALCFFAAGCATTVSAPPQRETRYTSPTPLSLGRPGVALVLSGGSARGFAHVGVIKVLEENGLRPDIVVGSSAGSIVGVLYASGLSASALERAVGELGVSAFDDVTLPGLFGAMGLILGTKLHRFIEERVRHHRIEDFPIRFAAVATDLNTGEAAIFNSGDAALAVRASCAVPGLMEPARIGGRLYGDGQIASPMPVDAARKLGARSVIAVDVVYPPEDARLTGTVRILFQAYAIAGYRLKEFEIRSADVVIVPVLSRTSGQMGFGDRDTLVAAGEAATRAMLERLRPLFNAR